MNSLRLQNCRGAMHRMHGLFSVLLSGLALCSVAAMFSAIAPSCLGAVVSIGPLPYLSTADSPFLSDPTLDVVLEDFEDGLFNVPGVITEPIGVLGSFGPFVNDGRGIVKGPSPDTDSVDADDGIIDGLGSNGHSFRSTATLDLITSPTTFANPLLFHFQPDPSGSLPRTFGFVWTDGEPGPDAKVELGVLEKDATGLMTTHLFTYNSVSDDISFDGGTFEDRFIGVSTGNEILSVRITSSFVGLSDSDNGSNRQLFFEMDHLQFGYTRVPEPASVALSCFTCMLMLVRRTC